MYIIWDSAHWHYHSVNALLMNRWNFYMVFFVCTEADLDNCLVSAGALRHQPEPKHVLYMCNGVVQISAPSNSCGGWRGCSSRKKEFEFCISETPSLECFNRQPSSKKLCRTVYLLNLKADQEDSAYPYKRLNILKGTSAFSYRGQGITAYSLSVTGARSSFNNNSSPAWCDY